MYVIGAYIKLYPIQNISKKRCFFIYLAMITCAWFTRYLSHFFIKSIFGLEKELNLFIDYTSVFIIVSGIALFLLFEQIEIRNLVLRKFIAFVSGLSFSVYIIHVHPFVIEYIIKNRFIGIANNIVGLLVLEVLAVSFLVFLVCLIIDIPRYFLFNILQLQKLPVRLMNKFYSDEKK